MRNTLFVVLLIFGIQHTIFSQTIQSPNDFLGYEIGTQFSRHHEVVDYFESIAETRPKEVKLVQYGTTNERRPLYLAMVSSEENMANLEDIRINHLKNAGIVNGSASNTDIAIVWLSYNVHGNEASSTEAAMLTIYKLLTEHKSYLENTVVIIDPCVNPDGRDRYVNWYNETASQPYDIDRQSREHKEPWPGGRPNHYLFDLNRDWVWATQVETQARLKVYNKWLPHIHVDFHEQGMNEPYYFAPAAEPIHEIVTDWQREFQTEIGKNHARYFDKNDWLFFTRERFDLLYPSYGDTYPTFMGGIGMTYEQGGHGMAGLGILNDEGHVLTLKERLTHHTTTGISTVEMAARYANKLNTEFSKFFDNSSLKYKSYTLTGNEDKIQAVKSLLDKHEIFYENPITNKVSGFLYGTGKQGSMEVSGSAMVIHTDQPKGKMVKVLFEPQTKLTDSLTYDITSWSIPYAYGLKAVASASKVNSGKFMERKTLPSISNSYGYVCEWKSLSDGRFLAELLNRDIRVRFSEKPFTSNDRTFNRGALIILSRDNTHLKDFINTLNSITQKHGEVLTEIKTGFSQMIPDMGSPDIKLVPKQRIALLGGEGTSSLSFGELWHFFEKNLNYPATILNTEDFNQTNLNNFDVLILPNGYYNNILNNGGMKKLKEWVSSGGKVIAIGNALRSFAGKEGFSLNYKTNQNGVDQPNLTPYAERERQYSNNRITGAIFKTKIDSTHPMAFGYSNEYFTLKRSSSTYELLKGAYNVGYLKENKPYSGFAGKSTLDGLKDSLIFGEERKGSGSFIYIVDNILFRSFWENGKLFLVNSIFFVNNNGFKL